MISKQQENKTFENTSKVTRYVMFTYKIAIDKNSRIIKDRDIEREMK